jgi:hypothetical protein
VIGFGGRAGLGQEVQTFSGPGEASYPRLKKNTSDLTQTLTPLLTQVRVMTCFLLPLRTKSAERSLLLSTESLKIMMKKKRVAVFKKMFACCGAIIASRIWRSH